jgi:hypothetical protein
MRLSQKEGFILDEPDMGLEADNPAHVPAVLSDVERLTQADRYLAAGFLTYEAGAAFGLRTLAGRTVAARLVCLFPSNA